EVSRHPGGNTPRGRDKSTTAEHCTAWHGGCPWGNTRRPGGNQREASSGPVRRRLRSVLRKPGRRPRREGPDSPRLAGQTWFVSLGREDAGCPPDGRVRLPVSQRQTLSAPADLTVGVQTAYQTEQEGGSRQSCRTPRRMAGTPRPQRRGGSVEAQLDHSRLGQLQSQG